MARGMFHRLPPSPPPSSTQIYPHPTSLQDESTVWRDLILRVWHVAPLRSVHNSPFIIHPPFSAFWAPHTRNRPVAWPRVVQNRQTLALDGTRGI